MSLSIKASRLVMAAVVGLGLAQAVHGAGPAGSVEGALEWAEPRSVDDIVKGWNKKIDEQLTPYGGNGNKLGGFLSIDFFRQTIQQKLTKQVPSVKFNYNSRSGTGEPRVFSGRVLLPSVSDRPFRPLEVPLVLYCHATETRKHAVPSEWTGDEVLLGAMAAGTLDFAVLMPDQAGMGIDDAHFHPYCHGNSLAYSVLDMVPGALKLFEAKGANGVPKYKWNGKFYIMGYSEGGYTAMAAVRELARNPTYLKDRIQDPRYSDIQLTASACMAGPYDFAGSVLSLLQDKNTPYARPYIPAYMIYGWREVYGQNSPFDPHLALNTALVPPSGPNKYIADKWFDGTVAGDDITPKMQALLSKDRTTASEVLDAKWMKDNLFSNGGAVAALKENNLYGGWAPKAPMLLVHPPKDECVPFRNAETIRDAWRKFDPTYQPLPIFRLEMAGAPDVGHVPGAVLSIPLAFAWFKAGAPKSFKDAMLAKIESLVEAPDRTMVPTLVANHGNVDMNLKIIDKLSTTGNVLIVDPGARNEILAYLTSPGDLAIIRPGQEVEVYFIPSGKAVAMKVEFGNKVNTSSVQVYKQMLAKVIGPPSITPVSGDPAGRITFTAAAFETPTAGYLFEYH